VLFDVLDAADVIRAYLAEIARLATGSDVFSVLAHIDYPVRYWPAATFDPAAFEDEFRHALRTVARTGRALEINTKIPLHEPILRWWREEGGEAVTFGSDAHHPSVIAAGFREAAHLAEAYGFRPGPHPHEPWPRAT
jgi:histidinol-phosphatase (PHP family)